MIRPDDDFEEDFDDGDPITEDPTETIQAQIRPSDARHQDTRRKIEDILEQRRLAREIGELDLD